jgi:3-hydroxybutyryl-CoA dehydrogenase
MDGRMTIAIMGAGLMGHGIAQIFARRGHAVRVQDPLPTARESVPDRIRAICRQVGVDSGCLKNVSLHAEIDDAVRSADFVIEAAPEKVELKQALFVDLSRICPKSTILATNSSVIPVATVAAKVDDGDAARIIGTHFWNPPYLIPVVEVIQGDRSNPEAIARTMELLASVGKKPVHVRRDVVIGNRFQHALWREAMAAVDSGICDPDTVDTIIRNTIGLRLSVLGPLENADLIGLDLSLDIHENVLPQLNTSAKPIPILEAKVRGGQLGMKSGRGFYDWTPETADRVRRRLSEHLLRTLLPH